MDNIKTIKLNSNNYVEIHLLDDEVRPIVLIAPGGAYLHTSWREGLPIEKKFQEAGFHTGIINYRETFLMYPDIVAELAEFIKTVRINSKNLYINQIYLCGASAGGHYIATLGADYLNYGEESRPDALILAYPVITGKAGLAHDLSITQTFGKLTSNNRHQFSVDERIHSNFPPTFIFHTVSDSAVPFENSLLLFNALSAAKVPVELHLYQKGDHGLSIATREVCNEQDPIEFEKKYQHQSTWIHLAISWLVHCNLKCNKSQ